MSPEVSLATSSLTSDLSSDLLSSQETGPSTSPSAGPMTMRSAGPGPVLVAIQKDSGAHSRYRQPAIPAKMPETVRHLQQGVDSRGKKTLNGYIRLHTIGHGTYSKVWLCTHEARPSELFAVKCVSRNHPKKMRRLGAKEPESSQTPHGYTLVRRKTVSAANMKTRPSRAPVVDDQDITMGLFSSNRILREICILKLLNHENVVQMHEVIDDPHSKNIYLVFEYLRGGPIPWQLRREADELDEDDDSHTMVGNPCLTIDQTRRIFVDVVEGLSYLHAQGILHRDIKPANLLWDPDLETVKISDFGVSCFYKGLNDETVASMLRTTSGTPAFFAPELCGDWNDHEHVERYDPVPVPCESGILSQVPVHTMSTSSLGPAIDVWALGATLFCFLFGSVPFRASSHFELYNAIVTRAIHAPRFIGAEQAWAGFGPHPLSNPPAFEPEEYLHRIDRASVPPFAEQVEQSRLLLDLLDRLLAKDSLERISLNEVRQHPWTHIGMSPARKEAWIHGKYLREYDFVSSAGAEKQGGAAVLAKKKDLLVEPASNIPVSSLDVGVKDPETTPTAEKKPDLAIKTDVKEEGSVSSTQFSRTPFFRAVHARLNKLKPKGPQSPDASTPLSTKERVQAFLAGPRFGGASSAGSDSNQRSRSLDAKPRLPAAIGSLLPKRRAQQGMSLEDAFTVLDVNDKNQAKESSSGLVPSGEFSGGQRNEPRGGPPSELPSGSPNELPSGPPSEPPSGPPSEQRSEELASAQSKEEVAPSLQASDADKTIVNEADALRERHVSVSDNEDEDEFKELPNVSTFNIEYISLMARHLMHQADVHLQSIQEGTVLPGVPQTRFLPALRTILHTASDLGFAHNDDESLYTRLASLAPAPMAYTQSIVENLKSAAQSIAGGVPPSQIGQRDLPQSSEHLIQPPKDAVSEDRPLAGDPPSSAATSARGLTPLLTTPVRLLRDDSGHGSKSSTASFSFTSAESESLATSRDASEIKPAPVAGTEATAQDPDAAGTEATAQDPDAAPSAIPEEDSMFSRRNFSAAFQQRISDAKRYFDGRRGGSPDSEDDDCLFIKGKRPSRVNRITS